MAVTVMNQVLAIVDKAQVLFDQLLEIPGEMAKDAKLLWKKTALARAIALEVVAGIMVIASIVSTMVLWFWGFPDTWHAKGGLMPPITHSIGWAVFALFWLVAELYVRASWNRKRVRRWGP